MRGATPADGPGIEGAGELEGQGHAADVGVPWVARIPAALHCSPAARIPAALHPHLQCTDLGVLPDPAVYMHGGTLTESPGRRRLEGTDLVLCRN
jgi:hypothetical protein